MSSRRRELVDFAVIGDGPIGLLAALKLHQLGYSCTLMAPKPAQILACEHWSQTPDLRVYALAPDCLDLLRGVIDWSKLRTASGSSRTQPYQAMRVFEAEVGSALAFDASAYGWESLGEIVEHTPLCQLLMQALIEANVPWIDARAERLEQEAGMALVHSDQHTLRARFVLDASGAHSRLREQAAISVQTHAYGQSAVIARIECVDAHQCVAWQRFSEHGTIALLPLFDGSYALVYSALNAKADQLMQMSDSQLLAELQNHFVNAAGQFKQVGQRIKVELNRALANRYVQGSLILIGDSAHVVHPLAGQGLNLGIRDLACLIQYLNRAKDISQLAKFLPRFERERKSENAITASAIEGLQKLFLPQSGPLKLLRDFGLSAVQNLAPLKRLFAELAAGKVAW
jgi:3-demethoxyubiquinol 3-hydroxylase